MTFCVGDTTPETWHRTGFNSSYLNVVSNYIEQHKINAKISGAITYGVLGPAESIISFESKDEFDAFTAWFSATDEQPMIGGIFIYIPGEDMFDNTSSNEIFFKGKGLVFGDPIPKLFPVEKITTSRGSLVTEFPKGDEK